jgi:hypothetical protein
MAENKREEVREKDITGPIRNVSTRAAFCPCGRLGYCTATLRPDERKYGRDSSPAALRNEARIIQPRRRFASSFLPRVHARNSRVR